MIQTFKDIAAILSFYNVKTFRVYRAENIIITKKGIKHYHNWSYKENAIIKTGEISVISPELKEVIRQQKQKGYVTV